MNNKSGIDFNTGIYIRLSQEDKDKKYESDSESVINQRELLTNYVRNNNFNLVGEYVDDGYSGTDFERPGPSYSIYTGKRYATGEWGDSG